jgi:hypothetical protein
MFSPFYWDSNNILVPTPAVSKYTGLYAEGFKRFDPPNGDP